MQRFSWRLRRSADRGARAARRGRCHRSSMGGRPPALDKEAYKTPTSSDARSTDSATPTRSRPVPTYESSPTAAPSTSLALTGYSGRAVANSNRRRAHDHLWCRFGCYRLADRHQHLDNHRNHPVGGGCRVVHPWFVGSRGWRTQALVLNTTRYSDCSSILQSMAASDL